MEFFNKYFKGDKYIWGVFIFLMMISLIEAFNASSALGYRSKVYYLPAMGHIKHLLIGVTATALALRFPLRMFRYHKFWSYVLMLISIVFLIWVQFTAEINGAKRHIFGFQPSEVGKFACIVFTSCLLPQGMIKGKVKIDPTVLNIISICCGIVIVLIGVENLSTAFLLLCTLVSVFIVAGLDWQSFAKRVGILMIIGFALLGLNSLFAGAMSQSLSRMQTWTNRIENFISPETPLIEQPTSDANQQEIYARMAIANGGFTGKFFNGKMRDFLPLAFSDFVFCIIIEDFGIGGGIFILLSYIILLVRVGKIFHMKPPVVYALIALGLTFLTVYQAIMNMGVAVGAFPVTGQPLPLISRGGTSIILTCAYFGIIQQVYCTAVYGDKEVEDKQFSIEGLKRLLNTQLFSSRQPETTEETVSEEIVVEVQADPHTEPILEDPITERTISFVDTESPNEIVEEAPLEENQEQEEDENKNDKTNIYIY